MTSWHARVLKQSPHTLSGSAHYTLLCNIAHLTFEGKEFARGCVEVQNHFKIQISDYRAEATLQLIFLFDK